MMRDLLKGNKHDAKYFDELLERIKLLELVKEWLIKK